MRVNLANWEERAPAHARSQRYAVASFLADPDFISQVVRFDRPRLGDLSGVRGLHLQCHIGTDTVSLARLGARMTGVDFSPAALAEARELAGLTRARAEFLEATVYDAPEVLAGRRFGLVYTGIGALCWLPDIRRWAAVVAALLEPGGRLFMREGHPMLWALEDGRADSVLALEYPYFETADALVLDEPGTYVDTDVEFQHNTTHSWNHGLGEIVSALLEQGLRLTALVEHDSVPWDGLPGLMEEIGGGEFRLRERPQRLAHSYTLEAVKER